MTMLEMLSDPKSAGLIVLIAVGATIVGKMVHNIWPKHQNPMFWGSAVAMLLVGLLAYLGVAEALVVVWVFIAIAAILGAMALVF
jgi:phosphatidylserine decarboxylase